MSVAAAVSKVGTEGSDKRPGAFRTISEASAELDVPQHVLRFWETRFAQIKPVKRAGGRRYYRPEDIELLKGIRHLLHAQGYTIKGAQRILKDKGVRFVQAVGRGEAFAAAPLPDKGDVRGAELSPSAFDDTHREALEEALDELRTCRAALASLASLDEPRARHPE